ncbi:MAG: Flagellar P-ring protein precursor [Pseudomonadota bacterium]|jgi:flagellar P-ring protein precursor FlgI
MNLPTIFYRVLACMLIGVSTLGSAWADRIKDLVTVGGVRPNQLIGYGLVVGLQGTGDGQAITFTGQSVRAMLDRLGVSVDAPLSDYDAARSAASSLDLKNVAAVMVTAELPPFAKPGQRIDINVSAMGKAESLRGGSLLLTRLRGVDGQVYALAQGALTVAGAGGQAAGSQVQVGVTTAGRVPGGGLVERMVETPFETAENIILNVRDADFSTAAAIAAAINQQFGEGVAQAIDGVSIAVRAPQSSNQRVAFLGMIENLDVKAPEPTARVVVNSRTGTVVISRNVRVTAAAVTHGTISVQISATNEVSQPNPLSGGQTVGVTNADVQVSEERKPMVLFQPGVDLRAIVDAVNQIGATPTALIAILEALKSSGSLRAELVVI